LADQDKTQDQSAKSWRSHRLAPAYEIVRNVPAAFVGPGGIPCEAFGHADGCH
jgi:hypothetical protein